VSKVYLVWYRLEDDTEDRIRGAALNWERAETMALNLEFYLSTQSTKGFQFGVKSYEHGSMRMNLLEDDGCFNSWGKEEFGE
tara:strand:- start:220 stop:465 length:246 start_codon:yes stop_codon:yes gene_type:complete